jgi:hypothetical protein
LNETGDGSVKCSLGEMQRRKMNKVSSTAARKYGFESVFEHEEVHSVAAAHGPDLLSV